MILAWSITEVVRYPYYIFPLLDRNPPKFWTWMRYSFFYVLYPVGAMSEWLLLGKALLQGGDSIVSTLRYDMPNKMNMIFDYRHLIFIIMLTYFWGFPIQYRHMIKQRKHHLPGKVPSTIKTRTD